MGNAAARTKLDSVLEKAKFWSTDDLFVEVQVLGKPAKKAMQLVHTLAAAKMT
jgi:hypothetical protein